MTRGWGRPLTATLGLALLGLTAVGCAESDTASLNLALYAEGDYFTLEIHGDDGATVYDTGCLQRQARTFRISHLEVAENLSVVFHYYADVSCNEGSHIGVGLRGG
ncbi:MAG: hypothetical protein QF464_02305, partial [Myxococcota bacterium]|nr:hypothetical protein [Myxococcota bacterium]